MKTPSLGPAHRSGAAPFCSLVASGWLCCGLVAGLATPAPAAAEGFASPYGFVPSVQRPSRRDVLDIEWRKELVDRGSLEYAPRELAGPTVDPRTGDVIVGTRDGMLRALAADGRVLWELALGSPVTSPALITPDAVYVGASDGKLHALERFAGTERWATYVAAEALQLPVLDGGVLFVGTDHDAVHALDAATGASRWVYRRDTVAELSIRGGTGVSVGGGRVYAGFSDGAVVALDPKAGRLLWESQLAASGKKFRDSEAAPIYRDGTLFATSFSDGVFALEASTGKQRWKSDAPGATSIALGRDVLLVGASSTGRALRLADGGEVWRVTLGGESTGQPQLARRLAVFSTERGLVFVDGSTGEPLRRFDPGSGFSTPPAVHGRAIYALSNLGSLYRLRMVAGEKREPAR